MEITMQERIGRLRLRASNDVNERRPRVRPGCPGWDGDVVGSEPRAIGGKRVRARGLMQERQRRRQLSRVEPVNDRLAWKIGHEEGGTSCSFSSNVEGDRFW